jgi:16S rRNA (guanine(527)-N(7))-methyltransferase RsmG
MKTKTAERTTELFKQFVGQENLNPEQASQFERYLALLLEWNDKINLTAITQPAQIIKDHFQDSLHLKEQVNLSSVSMICDIGSGAGFPGIPLKIAFPHLKVILLEVTLKKVEFLKAVIKALDLQDIEVCELDWRTFLRKTQYPIDLFVTRASLPIDELLRVFKPSSPYKDKQIVYWASQHWVPAEKEQSFVRREESYKVGFKVRKLIFFASLRPVRATARQDS